MRAVFVFSFTVRSKFTGRCPQITVLEEKGQPKRGIEPPVRAPSVYRSITHYRLAKTADTDMKEWKQETQLVGMRCVGLAPRWLLNEQDVQLTSRPF